MSLPYLFRLQGTDGIRQVVARSTDYRVSGMTPQQAFSDGNLLTEQFVELYCFAYAASLPRGSEVVVGWDPRDPQGLYTEAAVAGVRKAGATSVVVGVLPTPGVALYQVWRDATASIVITASHNFRDQNGIKIFQGPQALKLLPADDHALTRRVLDLDYVRIVAPLTLGGRLIDAREEAVSVFESFHLNPHNSWLSEGGQLGTFPLIVDTANGALSGLAGTVLRRLHKGPVIEVNADAASGLVNTRGGVADIEGVSEIHRGDVQWESHKGVQAVFEFQGKGAVFDADGDRFFRLDYDPTRDAVLVFPGDDVAFLLGRHWPPPRGGVIFASTVESDLNLNAAIQRLGYTAAVTAVGDKWLQHLASQSPDDFCIGVETSGHVITRGHLTTRGGVPAKVFVGSGLKTCVNAFAATAGLPPDRAFTTFEPGLIRTFYVYYVRMRLFSHGSTVYESVATRLRDNRSLGSWEIVHFDDEPDMLYARAKTKDGDVRAAVFLRKSGTENKIGVSVRGQKRDADELLRIGEELALHLATAVKDTGHPMTMAERKVLEALASGPLSEDSLPVPQGILSDWLFAEMAREHVILRTPTGFELTSYGLRMLEVLTRPRTWTHS